MCVAEVCEKHLLSKHTAVEMTLNKETGRLTVTAYCYTLLDCVAPIVCMCTVCSRAPRQDGTMALRTR